MIYSGSITILNEDGEMVFEKELSEDEVVETLLAAIPDGEAEQETVEASPTGRKCGNCHVAGHTTRTCPQFTGVRITASQGAEAKPCCGSKGKRHMKDCTGSAPSTRNRRTVDNRFPFSESTYNAVKTLLEKDGGSVDSISAEKGLDLDEVRRCNLADDYQDYLTIA